MNFFNFKILSSSDVYNDIIPLLRSLVVSFKNVGITLLEYLLPITSSNLSIKISFSILF